MEKTYTIIGNWKMYLTFDQTKQWLESNENKLIHTLEKSNNTLIVCPSFESLSITTKVLEKTTIKIGAQDCSAYTTGAYTGQISAQSLKQLGCNYCIIGHSERRLYQNETNEIIAQKCTVLFENNITPIVCIGESEKEYKEKSTFKSLENQLTLIAQILKNKKITKPLIIAYEPLWAIGTGKTPTLNILNEIFSLLYQLIDSWPNKDNVNLLYGGSVNGENSDKLKTINYCNGFLVGGASIKIEELTRILK